MELLLIRRYGSEGTNGALFYNEKQVCSTIELPWKQNALRISCIPEGRYELRKRYSQRYGLHLHVLHVPGRSLILLHAANDAKRELKGCIAPVSRLNGEGKGSGSRVALQKVERLVFAQLDKGQPVFFIIQKRLL